MLRNKLRYLVLLVAMGLLSILYNEYYMGIIFLGVVILPFFLFGLLSYCYGKIRAELVCVTHVANKGDQVAVSIQLNNPTIFPVSFMKIYLSYKNAYSPQKFKRTVTVPLDYRTRTSVICNLLSQYSGNLEITVEGIRIYDYMKLFSLKKKLNSEIKIAVLPNYYELRENELFGRNILIQESDYYSPDKKGDDPSEVFEIREYREGDRLQRIHWKLSSKLDQLMIKEFSNPMNCSILLFVNLNIFGKANVLSYMDAILECALSISYTLVLKGQNHYFSWFDEKLGSCRRVRVSKENDLFEAVDGLLQAIPYNNSIDSLSPYLAEFPHDQYSELFLISGEVLAPSIDSLAAIKTHNRQMIYMNDITTFSDRKDISSEVLQQYMEAGINLWPVDVGNVRKDMEQLSLG